MESQHFKDLLIDLYEVYNPTGKNKIEGVVNTYNGREFQAVYDFLFRFNYPKSEHYNDKIGNEQSVKLLIDSYSKGDKILYKLLKQNRPAQELISESLQQVNDMVKTSTQDSTEHLNKVVDDKLKVLDEYIKSKMEEINALTAKVSAPLENVDVKLNILWNEKEINIPRSIENMSIGTRFMTFDVEGKMHGMEVKHIFEDYVSYPGKCIKEITIDKV